MKKKIVIFTSDYNPNIGGAVVLHKLAHLINELGGEAYLYPFFGDKITDRPILRNIFNPFNGRINLFLLNKYSILKRNYKFHKGNLSLTSFLKIFKNDFFKDIYFMKLNPIFNSPLLTFSDAAKIENNDDYIVIYPEVVSGNPLRAKNVVRWFLHDPGFHTKTVNYGSGELYFRFGSVTKIFTPPIGSKISDHNLTVLHFPLELYNSEGWSENRSGTAYCIRKGKGKPIVHDLSDSILIDDLSHEEVSKIFKRVKQFISYDTKTAYSYFAAVCGCESVVIPDLGMTEDEWIKDVNARAGQAFGFQNLEKANSTRQLVEPFLKEEESKSIYSVKMFLEKVDEYFSREQSKL